MVVCGILTSPRRHVYVQSCFDAFKIENHFLDFVISSIVKCSFYLYVLYYVHSSMSSSVIIQSTLYSIN